MRDIKQSEHGDIDLSKGDLTLGEATQQHQQDILLTTPGALKHAPGAGVGIVDFVNDESPERLLRKARQAMIKDGMKVTRVGYNGETLEIDGFYEADFKP